MQAIRSINNNIAVCVDSAGQECIAMGKGIGYGKMPHEVELSKVTHTYYCVDERQLEGVKDIPQEVLAFAASAVDRVRGQLPYQLSPNLTFTLADHIAFAIRRAEQGIQVRMPLAYDFEQSYPDEFRLGRQLVRRICREFGVTLRDDEASGIAMSLVNARACAATEEELTRARQDEDMLEDITEIVENHFGVTVDRASFAFSRYATHLHYLFARIHSNEVLPAEGLSGYQGVDDQFPEGVACVRKICDHIHDAWGADLTDEERLYLVIHVSRICIKGTGR